MVYQGVKRVKLANGTTKTILESDLKAAGITRGDYQSMRAKGEVSESLENKILKAASDRTELNFKGAKDESAPANPSGNGDVGYSAEKARIESGKPVFIGKSTKISPVDDETILGTSYQVRKISGSERSELWRQGFKFRGDYALERNIWKGKPSQGSWQILQIAATPEKALAKSINKRSELNAIKSGSAIYKRAKNTANVEDRRRSIVGKAEDFYKTRNEAKQTIKARSGYLSRLKTVDTSEMDKRKLKKYRAEVRRVNNDIKSAQQVLKRKEPSDVANIRKQTKRKKSR